MLNPFYGDAIHHYLDRFSDAFADYHGAMPRAVYQDSYEYQSQWSPDLFAEFQNRRGYRLQEHLPELFGKSKDDGTGPGEVRLSRNDFRHDGRELHAALGEMGTRPRHVDRNQAHGSPGNFVGPLRRCRHAQDGDVQPRSRDVSLQICSSAGHVAGRKLISSGDRHMDGGTFHGNSRRYEAVG